MLTGEGFSIIVCCYNSAEVLSDTLKHLAEIALPAMSGVELIIVDNNCTDDTLLVAQRTWSGYGHPYGMRIVSETTPGLSAARTKGISVASYSHILFCDDDNWLSAAYLLEAEKILNTNKNIGALGGLGTPVYEMSPDYWFEDFNVFGSGPQAVENGPAPYLHGAGLIIRKEIFDILQSTDFHFLLSDRKGNMLSSGGDHELCYLIRLADYQVYYDDHLRFRHFITKDRVSREYCWRFIRQSAPAIDVLDTYRFLLCHQSIGFLFYIIRVHLMVYHLSFIIRSFFIRQRNRYDPQQVFLEDFHIRYHHARIMNILRSFFRYHVWGKHIFRIKKRLHPGKISVKNN